MAEPVRPLPIRKASRTTAAAVVRTHWHDHVEPRQDKLTTLFYARLFTDCPAARGLFPTMMDVQRDRFVRALVNAIMNSGDEEQTDYLHQLGRDHRKFDVTADQYRAAGHALLWALQEVAGKSWTSRTAKAWQDAYLRIARAMQDAADLAAANPPYWWAQVVDHERIGYDVAVVTILPDGPYVYDPGQYVTVETPYWPRLWRSLSPASAGRHDGTIEFLIRAVPGGWVSNGIVRNGQPGDRWKLGPPMGGDLSAEDLDGPTVIIAGGVGIAPFKALVDHLANEPGRPPMRLYLGARVAEQLYYGAELRNAARYQPWLDVTLAVSDDEDYPGRKGRVGRVAVEDGIEPEETVLIAGSPDMIRGTVTRLRSAGVPSENIRFDPHDT